MDSFEKRIQFSKQLSALTPAKQASQDLCNFLIRNYVIQEDLYPSILETLPLVNLNSRLNIFQFLDDLLTMIVNDSKYSSNDIIYNYTLLIVTDLRRIIQLVLPEAPKDLKDSSNRNSLPALAPSYSSSQFFEIRCLTNLPSTYIILLHISKLFKFSKLQEYQRKFHSNLLTVSDKHSIAHGKIFDDHTLYLTEAASKAVTADGDQLIPEKIKTGLESAWEFIIDKKRQSEYERLLIDTYENPFDNLKSENAVQIESNSIESIDETDNNCNNYNNPSHNNNNNNNSNSNNNNNINNNNNNNSNINSNSDNNINNVSNPLLLTHSQIMQRIEADRERQKRGKETLWQVSRREGSINVTEFEFIYDSLDLFDVIGDKGVIDEMDELYRSAIEVVEVKSAKNGQIHKNKNKNNNHHINSSSSSYGYPHNYSSNKSQWRDRRDTYDYGARRGASIPYNSQFKKRRYN